jgi:hypothetical protein
MVINVAYNVHATLAKLQYKLFLFEDWKHTIEHHHVKAVVERLGTNALAARYIVFAIQ